MYLASKKGLSFFDGEKEIFYPHNGKGKSIENIVFDQQGTLWCNTFKGDLFYLENDSLKRHIISKELSGLLQLKKLSSSVYLVHNKSIYEKTGIDSYTLKYRSTHKIRLAFEYDKDIYIIGATKRGLYFKKITQKSTVGQIQTDKILGNFHAVKWNGEKGVYFTGLKDFIRIKDLLEETLSRSNHFPYPSKVTYVTSLDGQLVISGFDGSLFYQNQPSKPKKILPGVQVSQIGTDRENNIIATSVSSGLFIIPSLSFETIDLSPILKDEKVFSTESFQDKYLFIGSNSGLLIRYKIKENRFDTLRFQYKGEVSTIKVSQKHPSF